MKNDASNWLNVTVFYYLCILIVKERSLSIHNEFYFVIVISTLDVTSQCTISKTFTIINLKYKEDNFCLVFYTTSFYIY